MSGQGEYHQSGPVVPVVKYILRRIFLSEELKVTFVAEMRSEYDFMIAKHM